MAVTTYKGAELPTVAGEDGTWGTNLNTNTFSVFDKNLGGIVSKSLTNANVTLTESESQNAVVRLTGTLSGNVQITTECQGFHVVENLCTLGAYAVTIKNDQSVTTVTVPYGRWLVVFDDTNGARLITPEAASATASGLVELATDAEAQTGTDTSRAVTPAGLQAVTATETRKGVVELATDAEAQTGTDTSRAVTPANVQALVSSQAEMEAASSTSTIVTPGRAKYHPGVAKAWVNFNQTGAQSIADSYGISSITDGGSGGRTTITFSTAFSSSTYAWVGSARDNNDVTSAIFASANSYTKTAAFIQVTVTNASSSRFDAPEVSTVFFGDQ